MAAYRQVYGFGHLWADCRGPGSSVEHYAHLEYGTTFLYILKKSVIRVALSRFCCRTTLWCHNVTYCNAKSSQCLLGTVVCVCVCVCVCICVCVFAFVFVRTVVRENVIVSFYMDSRYLCIARLSRCEQIAVLGNKQRESDRFLLAVKQQLVQAQRELFDELVLDLEFYF